MVGLVFDGATAPVVILFTSGSDSALLSTSLTYLLRCPTLISLSSRNFKLRHLLVPVISMIITPYGWGYGWVSLRGIRLDRCRPLEIWQVANEGQQPLICDVHGGKLRGFPLFLCLVTGLLSIFALTFLGLKRLLPL